MQTKRTSPIMAGEADAVVVDMVSKDTNPKANYTTLLLSIIVVLLVGIMAIAVFGFASMFGMMNGTIGGMMSGGMMGSASANSIGTGMMTGSGNASNGMTSGMMGG